MSTINEYGRPVGLPYTFVQPPSPSKVELEGKLCKVVPLAHEHAEDLHEAYFGSATLKESVGRWTYMFFEPPTERAAMEKWVDQMRDQRDPFFFSVIDKSSGKAVGTFSFLRVDEPSGSIEVGHVNFSPLMARSRMSTEAHYLLAKYAFGLGYIRYEWRCDTLNAPSSNAAQRLGFVPEGVWRHWMPYHGRLQDTAWFSITEFEWPKVRGALEKWLDDSNFDSSGAQIQSLKQIRDAASS